MDDLNQLLHFSKLHGLGNDYIFLDAYTQDLTRLCFPAVAQLISDRHFGIGSDGLILACRPADSSAHIRMRMFNSDGSEGEMCGNGLRCLVKFCIDHALVSQNPLKVETGAGTLQVVWERTDGTVTTVRVDMGRPRLTMREIPAVVPGLLSPEDCVINYTNVSFEGLR
jgi:diaminopimelate epimerase